MRSLRLVIVTRRFWPLIGGGEKVMGNLAVELAGRGWGVTILTAQWRPNWPERISFHEMPVVRLSPPPEDGWRTFRFVRAIARWLRENQGQYDLVYVAGLRHEAYAVLKAVGRRVPVVLRAETAGRRGDCLWQIDSLMGRRIKQQCRQATVAAASRAVQWELGAAGYSSSRLCYLPHGVPILPPRSRETKAASRAILRGLGASLDVPDRTLLAVYAGRLDADKSLEQLVLAWGRVHSRWPHARLWLAGDGAFRTVLQSQIKAMNMADHVKLIGVFDTVDVLLSAADLFVLPMTEGCPSVGLLEAMGAGLPIVAVNTRGNRDVLCDGSEGLLVAAGDVGAFCDGIVRLFEQSELASQLGAAARDRAMEEFSLAKMADDHVTWFEHLIEPLVDRSGCQCQEYR